MTRSAGRNDLKKFYLALAVLLVAGGAWIGYRVLRGSPTTTRPGSTTPAQLSALQASLEGGHDLGVSKGDPSAPVVVQEFADYQCPYCAQFAALTGRALDERYVKAGKIRWIFFDFPLAQHRNALPAAEAARCAGEQGDYWGMHDVLFARQKEWSEERNATPKFEGYARALRLDADALERCLDSGRYRDVIQQDYERGIRLGVESTPTFFIGRRAVRGAAPYDEFVRLLEDAIAAAGAQ